MKLSLLAFYLGFLKISSFSHLLQNYDYDNYLNHAIELIYLRAPFSSFEAIHSGMKQNHYI